MPAFDDLLGEIELPQCTCLNQSTEHTLRHCLDASTRDTPDSYLQSDCDEELLISLKFMQAVKISALVVQGLDAESAPSSIRLFKNKVGLDFDSAKSDEPAQEIELSKADVLSGGRIELRFVNFQGVQELSIFVPGNHGEVDETKISKLAVLGEQVQHPCIHALRACRAFSEFGVRAYAST